MSLTKKLEVSERGKLESTCLCACLPLVSQKIFCVSLLQTVLLFLTNQAMRFISHGIGHSYFIVGKLSHLGGVQNFLLERREKPEKGDWCRNGGVATFLLLYSSITFTLYVGKVKFSLLLFFLQSFELAMQDSHPSLYSTKILYHLYISDSFW